MQFYILGTAHVSSHSCDDVAQLIRAVRPEVVIVELCTERRPILNMDKASKVKVGGRCELPAFFDRA